jgi:hypothetical protein
MESVQRSAVLRGSQASNTSSRLNTGSVRYEIVLEPYGLLREHPFNLKRLYLG